MAGVWKTYMKPVDWDKDGVLDLLVTYEYKKKGHNPIDFYRGVQTDKGLRFEKRVPLFTTKDGSKALPGVQPMMTLTDYNNDGVQDIVFGLSVPTINGFEVADEVAWAWAGDLEIEMPGKDAGRQIKYMEGSIDDIIAQVKKEPFRKRFLLGKLDDFKYLTMRHRGYVFVMYGKKAKTKATPRTGITATPIAELKEIKNEVVKGSTESGPVKYTVKTPQRIGFRETFTAEVTITFDKGWHGYVDNKANKNDGFIPTTVKFEPTKYLEAVGDIVIPEESYKGLSKVYKGSVTFKQKFKMARMGKDTDFGDMAKNLKIKAKIAFQTCDANMCLPPREVVEELEMSMKQ